jgi:hypothetical protein
MNAVELLMGMDLETLEAVPHGEMEIKRLSKIAGSPFVVEYEAISGRKYARIASFIAGKDGKTDVSSGFDANLMVCVAGIKSPDLNSEDLQKRFKVATPKDLVEKVFTFGEVAQIASAIGEVSGLNSDGEEEVKN